MPLERVTLRIPRFTPSDAPDHEANMRAIDRWANLVAIELSTKVVEWQCIAQTAALATGDDQARFVIPEELDGLHLTKADAAVATASSSGLPTFAIRNATTDVLSTKVTIDINETSSYTAATRSVVNLATNAVRAGDVLKFDCDIAGTGTLGWWMLLVFT